MFTVYLGILVIAILWGGWPLVARSVNNPSSTMNLVIVVVAIFPVLLQYWYTTTALSLAATKMDAMKMVAGGLMMGTGMIFFNAVLASKDVSVSTVVPLINVSMLMVSVLGGVFFFSEEMTPSKIFGLVLLISGMVLIRP